MDAMDHVMLTTTYIYYYITVIYSSSLGFISFFHFFLHLAFIILA